LRSRPLRISNPTERRRFGAERRLHLLPRRDRDDAPPPVEDVEVLPQDDLASHPQERRARESGGPIDRAQYVCTCGFVFDADVSTSVSCPHCGTGQAW
jgi:hypothetical protein